MRPATALLGLATTALAVSGLLTVGPSPAVAGAPAQTPYPTRTPYRYTPRPSPTTPAWPTPSPPPVASSPTPAPATPSPAPPGPVPTPGATASCPPLAFRVTAVGADGSRVVLGLVASDGRPVMLEIAPTEWSEAVARTALRCSAPEPEVPRE